MHFNSTILSHAFYLAIEGGTNRTSGQSVQGVGAALLVVGWGLILLGQLGVSHTASRVFVRVQRRGVLASIRGVPLV